jgi:acyl-coenzyme A synthetase/AMP-(fatty) acid ligase
MSTAWQVPTALPLVTGLPHRAFAWHRGRVIPRAEFERHVAVLRAQLPAAGAMINLCEQRYLFLVAYAAALAAKQTVLLPSSRTEQIVQEAMATHRDSYRCDDAAVNAALNKASAIEVARTVEVDARHVAMIGMTSGSTGQPQEHGKLWHSVSTTTMLNAHAIRHALNVDESCVPWIVATVPPQHMFGMELSVLLPLLGNMAVHGDRPLFPGDVGAALKEVSEPRVLVTTPVHLRALVQSGVKFPSIGLVVCATAPLDLELAKEVERRLDTQLLEVFGSTETCIFAQRRTAHESRWRLHEDVELSCTSTGTVVSAPWFVQPTPLQDVMELVGPREFVIRGRNADMVEVAGKRASLADLTRRLLTIEGVQDAVMFQADAVGGAVRRMIAIVVAPDKTSADILQALSPMIDPAFMPRPLLCVERLPRNETGKLPRAALTELVQKLSSRV